MKNLEIEGTYHVPRTCKECGGALIFKGVGEYRCEDCGSVLYDDYGKVRLFLESHPGANATDVERETGVSQKIIRQMLREARIQVAEGSGVFLHCEICGAGIRFGKYCTSCEAKAQRRGEQENRSQNMRGFSMGQRNEEGQRRFLRGNDK